MKRPNEANLYIGRNRINSRLGLGMGRGQMRQDWYKVSLLDGRKVPKWDYRNGVRILHWKPLNCVLCVDDISIILHRTCLFIFFLFHECFEITSRLCLSSSHLVSRSVSMYLFTACPSWGTILSTRLTTGTQSPWPLSPGGSWSVEGTRWAGSTVCRTSSRSSNLDLCEAI